jgi:putative ABC transport system permease protein
MFDPEKAIQQWKKELDGHPGLEDGQRSELEAGLRDEIDALVRRGLSQEEAFRRASAEMGTPDEMGLEFFKVYARRPFGRPSWQTPRFLPALLANYFKVAGRRVRRQKSFSIITIAGLTVGVAAYLLLALYCRFERSYDEFYQNASRIFRVQNDMIYSTRTSRSAACPPGLGPVLKNDFPEVADFVRIFNASGNFNVVSRAAEASQGGTSSGSGPPVSFYEKRVFFADPSFFGIFSFPLVRGDAATALQEPDAVVLTESIARKYFGDKDPLRKTLAVTTRFGRNDFRVTAVCRDVPVHSHLRFDLLLSFKGLEALWTSLKNQTWASNGFLTYLLLSPSAAARAIEAKFPELIASYPLEYPGLKREFHLQPLRAIHLTSRLNYEADVNGDMRTVVFLEVIGLFILAIAWVNFINMATARSLQRSKEVGIRKTIGAERGQLAGQFLLESVFFNALAFFLALGVVWTVLPAFGRLVGKPLSMGVLGAQWVWMGVSIFAGALLSGSYPAFILSSFRPAVVLRGRFKSGPGGIAVRSGLVLIQFALAILMIASTLVVGKQLAYVRNRDLGADLQKTLVLRVPPGNEAGRQALLARDRLAQIAGIAGATVSTSVPGRDYVNAISGVRRQGASRDEGHAVFLIDVDERYFHMFGIPVIAGRAFTSGLTADELNVVLNEEAARLLGFESPEAAVLQKIDGYFGDTVQIIGVVRNYHHKSLRDKIEPVVYGALPYAHFEGSNYLALKIGESSFGTLKASVEKTWKELFPGQALEFTSLDEDFDTQYDADRRFGQVFALASLLAIFISCLGLSGLASYAAERRTREIGIRKVFGASIANVAAMLAGEFVRWVFLANIIAWPATWIVMNKWLGRFAYRTAVGWETLGLSGLLALAVALATVSVKVLKSARATPGDSIRQE